MTGLEVRLPNQVNFNNFKDNEIGMSAKSRYGVKGSQIIQSIQPTQKFYDLAKMDSISIERNIIKSNIFKKKYNEKLRKLKSLLKICYSFTTDLEGDCIERDKKRTGALGYCIFTDHTIQLLQEKYDIKVTSSELRRLVNDATTLGFLVPNTYKTKEGQIRKNYRYDLRNPANSYSTSYLVNFQAISSFVGKEIKEEAKEYYSLKNTIEITDNLETEVLKLSDPIEGLENKKLFSGIYDSGYLLREGKTKLELPILQTKSGQSLMYIFYDLIRILKEEGLTKPREIIHSAKYKEILKAIELTNFEDKTSYDTCVYVCMSKLFDWKTNGSYSLLQELISEYTEDKSRMNRKEFRTHITKNGVTGRGFSPYCRTSKLLDENDANSRIYWQKHNNIIFSQDVTSMIPNLSRFLKDGDKFKQEDLYTKMCKEIKKEYKLEVDREDMKSVFLRFKFSKSLPLAISQMKRALAKDLSEEGIYAKKFINYKTGKANYWLTDEWYKTEEGKQRLQMWEATYKIIEKTCGISKDSLIFFWESLLEQIILTNLKRQGITCYNIYDEFFSTCMFNLDQQLEFASKMVLEAYNGNIESLENFVRGK